MLEFKSLSTVGALEPPEHLVLLMADHVALQTVNIGKHLPTYSTILRKSLILTFYLYTSWCLNKHLQFHARKSKMSYLYYVKQFAFI